MTRMFPTQQQFDTAMTINDPFDAMLSSSDPDG